MTENNQNKIRTTAAQEANKNTHASFSRKEVSVANDTNQ